MMTIKNNLFVLLSVFLVLSCSKETNLVVDPAADSIDLALVAETDRVMADKILALINNHRSTLGLSKIKRDDLYASAYAVEHTKYMIDLSRINHDNFNRRSEALKNRGANRVGENVACGYNSAIEVVQAWLNSPLHKNIIEGNYTHSGFGIIKNNEGTYFFTQLFYK